MRIFRKILLNLVFAGIVCAQPGGSFFGSNFSSSSPLNPALVTHGVGSAAATSFTMGATTNSKLFVIGVGFVTGTGPATITDSLSNSYTCFTVWADTTWTERVCYVYNPSVSGSSLTVTIGGSPAKTSACGMAFSGVSSAPDTQNHALGGGGTVTTIQPGSITPSVTNELLTSILVFSNATASSASIGSSYAITDQDNEGAGTATSIACAWQKVSSTSALNPTWTIGSGGSGFGAVASQESWQ